MNTTQSSGTQMQPLSEGRYILQRVLGVGGMATVFLAWDKRLQVSRAIKVLSPDLSKKSNIRQRFESEAQTMAKLSHPNIVTVHDVGVDGDRAYIVMEMLPAGTLMEFIDRNGAMPPRMAVSVTIDLLNALEIVHGQGVVHRDIKPHNLLVSGSGKIKVSDFGIAHVDDEGKSMTKTGSVMGTWGFMSPEQRSSAKSVDARADVYACGATLYTLLTKVIPVDLFAAGLEPEMMDLVFDKLQPVIERATKYKSQERYASCAEMRSELEALVSTLPALPLDYPTLIDGVQYEASANISGATIVPPSFSSEKRDRSGETFAGGDFSLQISEELSLDAVSENMGSTLFVEEPLGDLEHLVVTEPRMPEARRGRFLVMLLLMVAGAGAVTVLWPAGDAGIDDLALSEPAASPAELSVDLVEPVEAEGVSVIDQPLQIEEESPVIEALVAPTVVQGAPVQNENRLDSVVAEVEVAPEDDVEPFYITQETNREEAQPENTDFIVSEVEVPVVAFFTVMLSGDVSWVALRSHVNSEEYAPPFDRIPAGNYNLVYRFGASSEITYPDTVTVGEGGTARIVCDSAFQNCVPRQ